MFGSGCRHSAYFTTLERGYAEATSGRLPARAGTGPALAVLAAVVILGERPGPLALVGAALVVAAVISLAFAGHATPSRATIAFALLTGTTIAAYTLWDAHAVEDLAQPTIAYYWGSEVTRAFVLAVPALRDREGLRTALAHDRRAILAVGALSPLAYILVSSRSRWRPSPSWPRGARRRSSSFRCSAPACSARARPPARRRRRGHPRRHRLPGGELDPWHPDGMPRYVCATCAAQFPDASAPPHHCPICTDERQYVPEDGQKWTTFDDLAQTHRNELREDNELLGVGTEPWLAIGQRALLVPHGERFPMWDCTTCSTTMSPTSSSAAAGCRRSPSHPHYYSAMADWAARFDCPVLLHADDERWITRRRAHRAVGGRDARSRRGTDADPLRRHFAGGTVLHWRNGAGGAGALLSGDIVQVIPDHTHVGFMYSYPNLIPLPEASVARIAEALEPYDFDVIYGAWWDRLVRRDAKAIVRRSAQRYSRAVRGEMTP